MGITVELFSLLRAASTALPAAVGPREAAATAGTISSSVVEKFAKPCHSKGPLAWDTALRGSWKAQERKRAWPL